MEAIDLLMTRRSIRKYAERPVNNELIEELIKCGMYAPSACNKQPWYFVVIKERRTLDEIADFHPNAKMLKNAPCAILVCGDEIKAHDKSYWPVDCSAATQNILLAAHARGMGACWLGIYPREERVEKMKKIVGLPEHIHAFALISLGFPAETPALPNRFDVSRIHREKW